MRVRTVLALFVSGLFLTACDPPGKPKRDEVAAADISDFKTIFNTNCSGCHGTDGKNGPGRILQDAIYLNFVPKENLKQIIEHGRAGTDMPGWAQSEGGPLTPRQIDILVEGMQAWKKPVKTFNTQLPPYEAPLGDPVNGKKLFGRGCFACHAPNGLVGSVTDPDYLSLSTDQNLRTSIVVGRPDLGMPDYRILNAGRPLSSQDVSDLVAYLSSLRPATSEVSKVQ